MEINRAELPIHGKSHQGTYYFRIRKARKGEATLFSPNDDLTIDVAILSVDRQPRTILATPIAIKNTIQHIDAEPIEYSEWNTVIVDINNKLLTWNE